MQTDSIFHERYLQAAREQGYPVLDDFNGAEQEGLGIYQVTHDNGERCSAARAYLFPHLNRPNLTIWTKATTHKIIIEQKAVVGVQATCGSIKNVTSATGSVALGRCHAISTPIDAIRDW